MYRDTEERDQLSCPRCEKPLPPLDVAACTCGTWVTAFAASEVLSRVDLAPDPITQWWRVRAPCPMCGVKMKLHGEDPGLLLGCAPHGYWIDADTIARTGLANADLNAIERKRNDPERAEAERARLEQLELAAAATMEHAELLTRPERERAAEEERSRRERRAAEERKLRAEDPRPMAQVARELTAELEADARTRAEPVIGYTTLPRGPSPTEAEREAAAIERAAVKDRLRMFEGAIGAEATGWLLGRLTAAERRCEELEQRVAELEAKLSR